MPESLTATDEWITGESPDRERLYVVHTRRPRFIAEFSEFEEGGAACHPVSEIDAIPAEDGDRLRREATEALRVWWAPR